jgi:hypothetical protein
LSSGLRCFSRNAATFFFDATGYIEQQRGLERSKSMSEPELCAAVEAFGQVVGLSEQLSKKGTRSAAILSTFFAMWCAFKIRLRVGVGDGDQIDEAEEEEAIETQFMEHWALPEVGVVRSASERLIACAASRDQSGISAALADMGVFALCPVLTRQFTRMELAARFLIGPAQQIPLVELSLFAVELGEYARASKYVREAHAFEPTACELYNLCVVEGLVALNEGRHGDAVRSMEESISACQRDEYASLACGVRGLNLALVQKLLDSGQRIEVLRHLLQCKDVWQSLGPQIDIWISLIESGETPVLQTSGIPKMKNEPAGRLLMLYPRVRALEEQQSLGAQPVVTMSPAEVAARRERLRAAWKDSEKGDNPN